MSKHYESDITKLINQIKQQQPDTELRQREGRSRLWDKHVDPELHEGFKQANVPQPPYVYYPAQ
ncbi:DUF3460 family protein [Yanghanlia caeni]|uniref:DUF3460 family protein n=1 Tax=Yanghanlia caeni TaxID=3064283 RepID=A0ABU1D713_9BURK|nr:DUF3460 family protein [Alcaligenaceae bacterium LG-2]NGR07674.1 DUF3460 family protein [bacterium SGD-2]HZH56950.1 DUF3460 family protein [Burkholderiaceae bacterium]